MSKLNGNPAVGTLLIVVTQDNFPALPVGIRAFCIGALIADRVFLTAGPLRWAEPAHTSVLRDSLRKLQPDSILTNSR